MNGVKMALFYIIQFSLALTLLIGCSISSYKEEYIASSISSTEGRFYLIALGIDDRLKHEFYIVVQENNEVVDGFYINEKPTRKEMRALDMNKMPLFFVFSTEHEVFRTGDLSELHQVLKTIKGETSTDQK